MKLRPFLPDTDFDALKSWITDERTHALWCAGRFAYPPERENFLHVLRDSGAESGGVPLIMAADDGKAAGFFCCSPDLVLSECRLKYVIVDPVLRGRGTGKAMLRLAAEYAFGVMKAEAVRLAVFAENVPALKCYESAGFSLIKTDAAAFRFRDETWSRCSMTLSRTSFRETETAEPVISRADAEDPEIGDFIGEAFARYGRQNGVALNYDEFCFAARNGDGKIAGALTGRAYYNEVHITDLIVDEKCRGSGLGSRLVRAVEDAYRGKGYGVVTLTTFGFQAPEFYRKLGYQTEFVRENQDPKLRKFFLKKDL